MTKLTIRIDIKESNRFAKIEDTRLSSSTTPPKMTILIVLSESVDQKEPLSNKTEFKWLRKLQRSP